MKTKDIFLGILLVVATGCNEPLEEFTGATDSSDGIIRVSTEISSLTVRAGVENINDLIRFNLFITNPANPTYSYADIEMRRDNTSQFGSYKDGEPFVMYWQNYNTAVDVIATTLPQVDPGQPTTASVEIDQREPEAIAKSDFIYYRKNGFIPSKELEAQRIPINFVHICSKLTLQLNLGNIAAGMPNPIQEVRVYGLATEGSFDHTSKEWEYHPAETPQPITLFAASYKQETTSAEASYECIMIPQSVAGNTLVIELVLTDKPEDNIRFVVPEKLVFKGNTIYTLSLTV